MKARVGDRAALVKVVDYWLIRRRERTVCIRWQFTTPDARVKLGRLYPTLTG
jgi:hypothetical protein